MCRMSQVVNDGAIERCAKFEEDKFSLSSFAKGIGVNLPEYRMVFKKSGMKVPQGSAAALVFSNAAR